LTAAIADIIDGSSSNGGSGDDVFAATIDANDGMVAAAKDINRCCAVDDNNHHFLTNAINKDHHCHSRHQPLPPSTMTPLAAVNDKQ
jgi:hypothetical protein